MSRAADDTVNISVAVVEVPSWDNAADAIIQSFGLPPHLVRGNPVYAVNDDPLAVAILEAWARQPFRPCHHAAFRDRLTDAGAPPEALAECDRLWHEACRTMAECPVRRGRLYWIRRHWAPDLRAAFLRQELPF